MKVCKTTIAVGLMAAWMFFITLVVFGLVESVEENSYSIELLYNATMDSLGALVNLSDAVYNNTLKVYELEERIYEMNKSFEERIAELGIRKKIKYDELLEFLDEDDTEENEYEYPEFTCVDYASMLVSRLKKAGFFSCIVEFYLTCDGEEVGHTGVAALTDRGVMYIEPMTDDVVPYYNFGVGDDYCKLLGWDCRCRIDKKVSCFDY